MLEQQQEKIKEVLNKFMEKSINSVLEGKVHKVDLVGVSLVDVLKYFNSKVPRVHQIEIEDVFFHQSTDTRFSYDASLEGKYSIAGDFFHSEIEFSLNSNYDY